MPQPLKRNRRDGRPYERPTEIENRIERLERVASSVRFQEFERSKRDPGFVPSEVLVYFLRQAWAEDMQIDFKRIFRILLKRVERSLFSAIPDSGKLDAQSIREEIMGRFAELIAEDCKKRDDSMYFYEVRFDLALANFRKSALRQLGPSTTRTVPLGQHGEDGFDVSAEVEASLVEHLDSVRSKLDDPAFRSKLASAIDGLPADEKNVIWLLLQDIPIDAKDKSTPTIARALQCDERTVRNRRNRACKALKAILQEENAP
jgi:DNA-directed RNA polymerase specialized sigma24 family protein